jgi:hypothetical protein
MHHPFRFINWKEEACVRKQPAQHTAKRMTEARRRFYMDFSFMRASTSEYGQPNKSQDRIVLSFDNYTSYLLIIDEALRYAWTFPTGSKDPPIDIIKAFLLRFGHVNGGSIQTD